MKIKWLLMLSSDATKQLLKAFLGDVFVISRLIKAKVGVTEAEGGG